MRAVVKQYKLGQNWRGAAAIIGAVLVILLAILRNQRKPQKTTTQAPKVLVGSEREILAIGKHPAALVPSVGVTLVSLVVAGELSTLLNLDSTILLVVWLAWLYVVIYLVFKLSSWIQSRIIVTDKRIILSARVPVRSTSIYMHDVTSWKFQDSIGGLLLGYKSLLLGLCDDKEESRAIGWIPLPAVREIEILLPTTTQNMADEQLFKEWAPGGGPRRSRLIVATLLALSMVILGIVVAADPHIRSDLGDQSTTIGIFSALIPIIISLVTP